MLALEISDLYKTYSSGLQALKGISLQVEQGDFFALLAKFFANLKSVNIWQAQVKDHHVGLVLPGEL